MRLLAARTAADCLNGLQLAPPLMAAAIFCGVRFAGLVRLFAIGTARCGDEVTVGLTC